MGQGHEAGKEKGWDSNWAQPGPTTSVPSPMNSALLQGLVSSVPYAFLPIHYSKIECATDTKVREEQYRGMHTNELIEFKENWTF